MIYRRHQSQIKRLKDLMSEVQENHTRIQRLWKKVDDSQLIWPVGIAAAPPIQEVAPGSGSESSSSSSSSAGIFCHGCDEDLPVLLTVEVSGPKDPPAEYVLGPWYYPGTYTLYYRGFHFGVNVWTSDCFTYFFSETKYFRWTFSCGVDDTGYFFGAVQNNTLGECLATPNEPTDGSTLVSSSCSPLHITFSKTITGYDYSMEVTE